MGSRKHITATDRKEANKELYFAKLNNCPSSPRKMRLVANMIRGKNVHEALYILQHMPNYGAGKLYKLVKSALANWQVKNEGVRMEDSNLYISEIRVDQGATLKRIKPAPHGRAHRIRKRSNHVTVYIDSRNINAVENEIVETETKTDKE
ncbi:MAG: 50S ribosomal protein L22 [Lentimicrobiaceae bacterium]|nr:50S ribosomal protein L22 [Lentimicrobiaceae bacterium]